MRVPAPAARTTTRRPSSLVAHVRVLRRQPLVLVPHSRRRDAPSPGLEPELSEPKSEVLPITPRRNAHQRLTAVSQETLVEADTLLAWRRAGVRRRAGQPTGSRSTTGVTWYAGAVSCGKPSWLQPGRERARRGMRRRLYVKGAARAGRCRWLGHGSRCLGSDAGQWRRSGSRGTTTSRSHRVRSHDARLCQTAHSMRMVSVQVLEYVSRCRRGARRHTSGAASVAAGS